MATSSNPGAVAVSLAGEMLTLHPDAPLQSSTVTVTAADEHGDTVGQSFEARTTARPPSDWRENFDSAEALDDWHLHNVYDSASIEVDEDIGFLRIRTPDTKGGWVYAKRDEVVDIPKDWTVATRLSLEESDDNNYCTDVTVTTGHDRYPFWHYSIDHREGRWHLFLRDGDSSPVVASELFDEG